MASETRRLYHTICASRPLLASGRTDVVAANDRYCLVAIGVLFSAVGYWAVWRILLPKLFGYELVPEKQKLKDGTVVTLVCPSKNESNLI